MEKMCIKHSPNGIQPKVGCVIHPEKSFSLRSRETKENRSKESGIVTYSEEKIQLEEGTEMPAVKVKIHHQVISVLRDRGTNTVLVRKGLVEDEELTGP